MKSDSLMLSSNAFAPSVKPVLVIIIDLLAATFSLTF